jgi:hypothetical protein
MQLKLPIYPVWVLEDQIHEGFIMWKSISEFDMKLSELVKWLQLWLFVLDLGYVVCSEYS